MRTCARLRPGAVSGPIAATKVALRSLAGRYEVLDAEVKALDSELARLVTEAAPTLVELFGVGPDVAHCWSAPATTPGARGPRPPSPTPEAWHPCPRRRARPRATASTAVVTARRTPLSTAS